MESGPLDGLTVGITAERRAEEQARLFHTRGAGTLHGPTMSISSLADDESLRAVTEDVIRRPPGFLVSSTGFGMRTWFDAAERWGLRAPLLEALARARVANRGAKVASVNTAAGLAQWWRAPNERFEELVARVLAEPVEGARVVLQLHGAALPDAVAALEAANAEVLVADAYRASLPPDPTPAIALVDATCARRLAAVTFTTAPALHNLFVLARRAGRADQLRQAFNHGVVAACVGPVCAEGAREEGITDPLVPERARLVPMVQAL
ncbi:MAG: uroporphyrinogen-III synthase, partial [Actinobacteria bacterium]|nr:uroporphyrinogen-III synthase [Actinomycetota bacterium]